jgi:hypothetical protein
VVNVFLGQASGFSSPSVLSPFDAGFSFAGGL